MSIKLTVTVDANGNPSVTPDPAPVPKGDKNVKLIWEMKTPEYEIGDITGLPASEFSGKVKNGTGYEIQDKNGTKGDYAYAVVVSSLKTDRQFAIDPTIRNEG